MTGAVRPRRRTGSTRNKRIDGVPRILSTGDRIEREDESDPGARPVDCDSHASAVQGLRGRMKVVTLEQTEESIEADAGPRVAVPLERAPLPRHRDTRHASPREPDRADCGESPEPHREGRRGEARRFRDPIGFRRRPSCERDENRAVDGVLPRDQEPFGCPRIHPGSEEGGAPAVLATFEESLVHELRHVIPERRKRLEEQAGRGSQVQARIRSGGEQDLEPAGVEEPAAASTASRRSHRDVLHVEDRPDLAGDAGWNRHETRMQ